MSPDPTCPRCGAPLKVETVRVAVPVPTAHTFSADPPLVVGQGEQYTLTRYEEREEISDCVRCTGAY